MKTFRSRITFGFNHLREFTLEGYGGVFKINKIDRALMWQLKTGAQYVVFWDGECFYRRTPSDHFKGVAQGAKLHKLQAALLMLL
jgi:hypothetical protein